MPNIAAFLKVDRRQHDKSVAGGGGGGGRHPRHPEVGKCTSPLALPDTTAPSPPDKGGQGRRYQRADRGQANLPPTSARLENIIRLEHD